jgi:cytoskeletal protein CcmA (bactofilin family)
MPHRPLRLLAAFAATAIAACSSSEGGTFGLAEIAAAEAAGFTRASFCTGTLGADEVEKVYVPSGATCTLDGTRVRGDVKVARGATLLATGARVDGNVQAEDAAAVSLVSLTTVEGDVQVKRRAAVLVEDAIIGGDLQIEERGASLVTTGSRIDGNLQVTKAASAAIAGAVINGDLQLVENTGALSVVDTEVRSNLQVFKNLAGVQLEDNRISQALQCNENSPAPQGGGNVAGEKEEQCAAL